MNTAIFNFFFSLSGNQAIAWSSLFVSNVLIYVFIALAILIPIIFNRKYLYSLLTLGTVAGAWIAAYIIKNIFQVTRPFIALHLTPLFFESGFSFPSSHVTITCALTVLVWKVNRKVGIIFLIFSILTAFSRMIIGVHYPYDVLGGAVLGLLIGLFVIWFYKIIIRFPYFKNK